MRDVLFTPGPSRIKGKPAIVKRLRGVLVAVERFGRHRARTAHDQVWAGHLIAGILTALADADTAAQEGDRR